MGSRALIKILNFYLYSSLHISIGAVALVWSISHIIKQPIPKTYYGFVFCSTLFIYGIHRIIGIQKTYTLNQKGRYNIVNRYKSHIQLYTLLGGLGSLILFFTLTRSIQIIFIIPGAISVLYTLPVFNNGKRLRDLHYIKIFLIASVWAVTTAFIPARIVDNTLLISSIVALERFCFFMAITIPFDIRDMTIDEQINVKTLVHIMGQKKSIYLALFFISMSLALVLFLLKKDILNINQLIAYSVSYAITAALIIYCSTKKSDYYFTGLLDGTMILLPATLWLFTI